ncbi:MAG: hypothetical protein HFE29_02955 [Clostridia bacterium]|jgi:hypothetical protein|nr:hypothetical protein [Clostridia bacterium]
MSNAIVKTYHNKDYGLIDLDALASYYNEVLGASFVVKANCILIPLQDDRTTCTLYAARVPFSIADVRSETLTLTLNFRVAWFPENERKKTLEEMKRLLGYQRFVIREEITKRSLSEKQNAESGKEIFEIKDDKILKTFNCTSFLEMPQPVGVPEIDCGKTVLDMQITGTVLVTDADGGAVMSNDVVTFAKLVGSSAKPVPLPIVYSSTNEGYNIENQVGTGMEMQIPVPLTAQGGLTIQALYLARDFEKQLLIGLKNKARKQIEITEVYDSNLTVVRIYNVLSFSEAKQAGAYMQYTLELQAYTTQVDEA